MNTKKRNSKWWESKDCRPPTEYDECYSRALRRMALALNCYSSHAPFGSSALKKSDVELQDLFAHKKIASVGANAALVNHERIDRNQALDDFDHAENLFYGDFNFGCPRGFRDIVRVTHRSTPAFR
jgi:hypothetical protein